MSIKMFLKWWHFLSIWYLFICFKTIILRFVHSLWFVKYIFFTKTWSMKTSTRIVKYESGVLKSNNLGSIAFYILFYLLQFFLIFSFSFVIKLGIYYCVLPFFASIIFLTFHQFKQSFHSLSLCTSAPTNL